MLDPVYFDYLDLLARIRVRGGAAVILVIIVIVLVLLYTIACGVACIFNPLRKVTQEHTPDEKITDFIFAVVTPVTSFLPTPVRAMVIQGIGVCLIGIGLVSLSFMGLALLPVFSGAAENKQRYDEMVTTLKDNQEAKEQEKLQAAPEAPADSSPSRDQQIKHAEQLVNEARSLWGAGRKQESVKKAELALRIYEEQLGTNHQKTSETRSMLEMARQSGP